MEQKSTDTSRPERLINLAAELETTPLALEERLGQDVYVDSVGYRCVTGYRASKLIEEHRRKVAEAEAEAQRASEEAKARREAVRARAIADRQDTSSRVQQFGLQTHTINLNSPDLPVLAMTAASDKDFDGGTYTKRPSRLDWLTGKGEGGASIGPTREQMQKAAEAKKLAKKGKRG